MGGAMDLTIGARVVIAATLHFQPSGASRMKRRCTLPLTAVQEVNLVVTDLGVFEVLGGRFHLAECFAPYTPEWIQERTDADIVVKNNCRIVTIDAQLGKETP
jgi:acetate CoA/acetoacetate CoA-transferase beta subunit